ncbi:S8 family serine peptidase [Candidatus Woesearchaeota archaeon]|nr:S8 family serine peptidase [Candidatus Woesearchaeota archaeon]
MLSYVVLGPGGLVGRAIQQPMPDLADYPLPFFDNKTVNAYVVVGDEPSQLQLDAAQRILDSWKGKICASVKLDNCPNASNPDQADANNDGVGNACQFGCGNGICEADETQTNCTSDCVDMASMIPVALFPLNRQVVSTTPTFRWEKVNTAIKYEVAVFNTTSSVIYRTFNTSQLNGTIAFTQALLPNQYVWQVRAWDNLRRSSQWSSRAEFVVTGCGNRLCEVGENFNTCPADCSSTGCGDTNCQPAEMPTCPADCFTASVPTLLYPINDVTASPSPAFGWNVLAGAVLYDLWIAPRATPTATAYRKTDVSDKFTIPTTLSEGDYVWWVRGTAAGAVSKWSAPGNFKVKFVCTDSDGGKNYFATGKVNRSSGQYYENNTDKCGSDGQTLVEYYCDGATIKQLSHMCQTGCLNNACTVPPACQNNAKDGQETDVDCGNGCPACRPGMKCSANSDCTTDSCVAGTCAVVDKCADTQKNGYETDVDCGGLECTQCANGKNCVMNDDCASRNCDASKKCAPPATAVCGNRVCEQGETGQSCSVDCAVTVCGNRICEQGETAQTCSTDCPAAVCGNGLVEQGEECDDGNRVNGDGCDATCLSELPPSPPGLPNTGFCGDGILQQPNTAGQTEECDDGNTVSGDGCSSVCIGELPPGPSRFPTGSAVARVTGMQPAAPTPPEQAEPTETPLDTDNDGLSDDCDPDADGDGAVERCGFTANLCDPVNMPHIISDINEPRLENNLILIGNSCTNALSAQLLNESMDACNKGVGATQARVKLVRAPDGKHVQLVIAGFTEAEDRLAAEVFANLTKYRDEIWGRNFLIQGTTFQNVKFIRQDTGYCENNKKDKNESDIDCGGPVCQKCDLGQGCRQNSDCTSNNCRGGKCQESRLIPCTPAEPLPGIPGDEGEKATGEPSIVAQSALRDITISETARSLIVQTPDQLSIIEKRGLSKDGLGLKLRLPVQLLSRNAAAAIEGTRVIVEFKSKPILEAAAAAADESVEKGLSTTEAYAAFDLAAAYQAQIIKDEQRRGLSSILGMVSQSSKPAVQKAVTFSAAFNGAAMTLTDQEAAAISMLPDVRVHADGIVRATLAESVPMIQAPAVWKMTDKSGKTVIGSGVKIAVIDTGIDYTHPDLGGCLGQNCKVVGGYDIVNEDNDPIDDQGHGTHVAATAAGDGSLKGVAPGAKLLAYKVLTADGWGYWSWVLEGIERAVDPDRNGRYDDKADVLSLSLGGPGNPDDPISKAIDTAVSAGSTAVVAAGNSGPDMGTVGSPGTSRRALTVGATKKCDEITEFSSRGPVEWNGGMLSKPDIVAPGFNICAAQHDDAFAGRECGESRIAISGTSMATPHVSGAVALLKQLYPGWRPWMLKSALMLSAVDYGKPAYEQGSGRLDVAAAAKVSIVTNPQGISANLVGKDSLKQNLVIRNVLDEAINVTIEPSKGAGGGKEYAVVTAKVVRATIPARGTASVELTIAAPPEAEGILSGRIKLTAKGTEYTVPFLVSHKSFLTVRVGGLNETRTPHFIIHNLNFSLRQYAFQGWNFEGNETNFTLPSGNYVVYALNDWSDSREYVLAKAITLNPGQKTTVDFKLEDARVATVEALSNTGSPVELYEWQKGFWTYAPDLSGRQGALLYEQREGNNRTVFVSNQPTPLLNTDLLMSYVGVPK